MFLKICFLAAFLAVAMSAGAQDPPGDQLSARELYYRESADQDKLPSTASEKPAGSKTTQVEATTTSQRKVAKAISPAAGDLGAVSPQSVKYTATIPMVDHLGLRYRLLLMDKDSKRPQPVDVDTVFHKGDCLALELKPNRTVYLYVVAKESSGNWHELFPNVEMPDESEIVSGQKTQQSPQNSCYELDQNAGEEHLFVILSRNPEQARSLRMALQDSNAARKVPAPAKNSDALLAEATQFNDQTNNAVAQLANRGFKITKLGSAEPGEEKYAVFVVPAALEKKDAVFADIRIKHQ